MLVWLVVATLAIATPANAFSPENRVWENLAQTSETHPAESPQTLGTHQENGGWEEENAVGCSLAAESTVPMSQRLTMVFDNVAQAPAATTAEEAMQQMHSTLDAVEDAYSGVPKNPNPGLAPDGRMYPVQGDRIVTGADGTITATSRGHVTTYSPNGSITVTDRSTGAVVFQKPGGG